MERSERQIGRKRPKNAKTETKRIAKNSECLGVWNVKEAAKNGRRTMLLVCYWIGPGMSIDRSRKT